MQVSAFELIVSIAAAVILFVFALKAFSADVQKKGGPALQLWLMRVTERAFPAFIMGAVLTALVQSSSAISGLTVALVESGTILFRSSLPVFLGANIGTTSTAWLVALNLTSLGSVLIVLSALIGLMPGRIRLAGKAVFYMGVILLALELISAAVAPLKSDPDLAIWLSYAKKPALGLLIGAVGAALLQSSSVTVGLAIIAVQQGLMSVQDVIPLVVGSNLGTTSTALIASLSMGLVARRAALANLVFNALGVLAFLPLMTPVGTYVVSRAGDGDMTVAIIHLIFNCVVVLVGFVALRPLTRWLQPAASPTPIC